jgi:hypothetical protein
LSVGKVYLKIGKLKSQGVLLGLCIFKRGRDFGNISLKRCWVSCDCQSLEITEAFFIARFKE